MVQSAEALKIMSLFFASAHTGPYKQHVPIALSVYLVTCARGLPYDQQMFPDT